MGVLEVGCDAARKGARHVGGCSGWASQLRPLQTRGDLMGFAAQLVLLLAWTHDRVALLAHGLSALGP